MNENISNLKQSNKSGKFQKMFAGTKMASFIGKLDGVFIKLPHLPIKIRSFISKIVPFLALIFGIFGLILSFVSGFFLLISFIAWDITGILNNSPGFLLILLSSLLLLKAFKPLRSKDAIGWIYLFWTQIIEAINLVIQIISGEGNVLLNAAIILLNFYLLFEIGQFYVYKNKND